MVGCGALCQAVRVGLASDPRRFGLDAVHSEPYSHDRAVELRWADLCDPATVDVVEERRSPFVVDADLDGAQVVPSYGNTSQPS